MWCLLMWEMHTEAAAAFILTAFSFTFPPAPLRPVSYEELKQAEISDIQQKEIFCKLNEVKIRCNKIFVYSVLEVPDSDACGINSIEDIVTSFLLSIISGVSPVLLAGVMPIQQIPSRSRMGMT